MSTQDAPDPGDQRRVLVSELIAAAQKHLELRGDTPVGVVVGEMRRHPDGRPYLNYLHIEPAVATGADCYGPDEPWYFEIECEVTEDD